MSSVLKTSTMKSPPLVVCVAGSLFGGCVSAAICSGPGSAALSLGCGGAGIAFAADGAASAAALARLAPLRKSRRATSGELLRRFMDCSERLHPSQNGAAHIRFVGAKSRAAPQGRQGSTRYGFRLIRSAVVRRRRGGLHPAAERLGGAHAFPQNSKIFLPQPAQSI